MTRWFNIDVQGNYQAGPPDGCRLVSGDSAEALASHALDTITDAFFREMGRPPHRMELELVWSRTLNKRLPRPPARCPESEVL
jgi:hypothetical protein